MFKYVVALLMVFSLSTANVYGSNGGLLAKIKSSKLVRTATVLGAAFVIACTPGCDDMKAGQVVDAIGGKDDEVTPPTSDVVIKIGMNYLGDRDPNSLDGAELAVAQINEAGGVNGMLIELIPFDNEKNQTISVTKTNELIEQGVVAFIGPEYSSHATTVGPIVTNRGVPMISTTATNPSVATSGDYVFMWAFTDSFQGRLMANFAIEELGAKTAAILTKRDDLYSVGLSETFGNTFFLLGGSVVEQQFYPNDARDFEVYLEPIAEKKPDVLFIPGHVPDAPLAAKQARAMGIEAIFLGGDGWGAAGLLEDGGNALEGSYFSDHFYSIPDVGLSQESLQFIADFVEMHGVRPISRSAAGYDTIYLVAEAIERAGSLDGKAIRDEIAATRHYKGATFIEGFDDDGYAVKGGVVKIILDGGIIFHKEIKP